MIKFKHIRSKLLVFFSLAAAAALLLTLALSIWLQTHLIRAEWQNSLQAQASLIAHNSQAALDFQDQREATRLLQSLAGNPAIMQASFYTNAGQILFARYRSPQLPDTAQLTHATWQSGEHFRFTDKQLLVRAAVPGDEQARLEIIASLEPMQHAIWTMALKTALYLSVLFTLMVLLANQVARRMASPLLKLSELTADMARNPQLGNRFRVRGEDELAQLGASFNQMIDSLQARDRELDNYRQGLEELVEQRTHELKIAVDAANEASRAKSDFLARMSHEIRTPMNAIVGLGQLLLKSGLNEHQRRQQEQVLSATDMLLGLIDDILDYSRIEAGKLEVEQIPFALEQILNDVSSQLALRAQQRGLELLLHLEADVPPRIVSDPLRLRQILINLVSNAIKFTEQGEIIVRVRHIPAPSDSAHDWLSFSVSDTGMGIPTDKLDSLFTPFTQVDSSMTRRFGGSGLGLAICRQLVDLLGGHIRVDSRLDAGSTFTFNIPYRIAPDDIGPAHLPSAEPGLQHKRALIIDDNASAREILQAMLDELGMRTQTAASGEQGLQMLQQASAAGDPFELILLDWLMPGMDGIETARNINSRMKTDIPAILMVTAGSYEKLSILGDSAGLKHILTKPVNRSALHDSILESLNLHRNSSPHEPTNSGSNHDFSPIHHARILLVDDVEINRMVALALLEETGVQVDTAEHGRQALDMLNRTRYDLILMDIQMPEMDGLTATREIRKQPSHANLPIVAMTAHARASDREASLQAGMNDHLTKPVNQNELYHTLLKWIPHRQVDAAQTPVPAAAPLPAPATTSQPAGGIPGLPVLPGIDSEVGLRHSLNKPDLYLRILSRFPLDFANNIKDMRQAIATGDWPLARRLAHSLKSGAATIGAIELSTQARHAELALAEAQQPEADALEFMEQELQRLCGLLAGLHSSTGAAKTTEPATAPAGTAALKQIEQLEHLLANDDAGALALLAPLHESLPGQPAIQALLDELNTQIEDIEYEAALALLPELRSLLQEPAP